MKKFKIIFLVFISFATLAFVLVKAASLTSLKYTVTVEPVGALQSNVQVLNSPTFYGNLNQISALEDETYKFCFYTENDIVISYEKIYKFKMSRHHHFKAYFKDPTKHYVVFLDANDKLLSFQVVEDSKNATLPKSPNSRYGYTFVRWNKSHTNVTQDLVIKAVYSKESTPLTIELEVNNEQSTIEWIYGKVFTFEVPKQEGNNYFSHWLVNGQKRSISNVLSLSIYEDTSIKAVYSYAPHLNEVILYFNENVIKSDNKLIFRGAVINPGDVHNIIEYGILTMPYEANVTLDYDTPQATIRKALRTNEHNEFSISIDVPDQDIFVRAYVVVRKHVDNNNEHIVYYSDIIKVNK